MAKKDLLRKYKESPKALTSAEKDELIREYAPLIKFVARKIAARLPSSIDFDDLISSGVIGLLDAIEKYDFKRDNKFKTYAEFRIRGAILDELRSQDWVPRSIRDKAKLLDKTILEMKTEKGRLVSDEEVAKKMDMSLPEYYSFVNEVRPVSVLSIDNVSSYSNMDKKSMMSLLEKCHFNPFKQLNVKVVKKVIAKSVESLPEKQRLILSLYYYEELNLKEIGKILRVTESRVSQLHAQAIQKLKIKFKKSFDEEISV